MDVFTITLGVGLLLSVGLNLGILVWFIFSDKGQPHTAKPGPHHYTIHIDGKRYFTEIDEMEIRRLVQQRLAGATAKAAMRFEQSLDKTIPRLTSDLEKMNSKTLHKAFEKYQVSFEALHAEALEAQQAMMKEIAERRDKLQTALDKKIVADYQQKLAQFDERLRDVVTSYVVESLTQPADLGAQLPAILTELERHKEKMKQDITE